MAEPARRIDYQRLDDLQPAPRNPKRHAEDDLDASVARWGFTEPILLDERTGRLVAGHGRLDMLRRGEQSGEPPPDGVEVGEDGRWLMPVVRGWASRDDAEAEAYLLASNRLGEKGGWDDRALADMLGEISEGPGLLGTGYDAEDLAALLAALEDVPGPKGGLTGEDEVPPVPPVPRSKPGDLWLLGEHLLLCSDSTMAGSYAVLLGDERADMVWTDPPYGVDYGAKNRFLQTIGPADRLEEDIAGDGADPEALKQLLAGVFDLTLKASRPGAVWFVAAPPGPPLGVFAAELLRLGVWRQMLCWLKNRPIFGRSDYHYQHETLFYGWAPGAAHQPPPTHSTSSVWSFDSPAASKLHPTMKPVGLVAQAVADHTIFGQTVLDPFAGSGTTLIACQELGRQARLIELSPIYVDVICARFEAFTGVTPILEATGEPVSFARADSEIPA